MSDFRIVTDSSCDLPAAMAEEMGILVAPLTVDIADHSYKNYLDAREISFEEFYSLLRSGKAGKTSAANVDQFESIMEPVLAAGEDVLYLGFSSALSGTYNAGRLAAENLAAKYPDRAILTVDTLCASMGQGMMLYLAYLEKQKGKSASEVRDFVEKTKLHLCHWFTVDDLNFLRRGGRVSSAVALVGTMLQIKPIMHVDDTGHLVSVSKVRGRKNALRELAKRMKDSMTDDSVAFISHGDCLEDAETLAGLIRRECGARDVKINFVGPVIGSHSGPGTMALFFLGKER